ncbi:Zn-dependent hydrolase [Halopenitus persicus]|uniref:N-carbamoyl-L-amino-acid hydrolase n=1 Tax=Halopenitus persicus TaxID=1048396 RepID=A0A1H3P9U4_9EURY|nr:Zn-dependent hydrolase [Halopenitus persicus]SDY97851.1 N-carbamoyl-L-amino-acid hydrolase [Halopenitus persicus]
MNIEVDQERLRKDIEENGRIGQVETDEGWGRTVLTGTKDNRRVRDRFVEQMESIGLDVRVDSIGNIVGRWMPSSVNEDASAVVAGSHLDSVPYGGIFDGPLGVYGALEAVRAMQDADIEPTKPIKVVSWTEEEGGRFGPGLLGSAVATGTYPVDDALNLRDNGGRTLESELEQIGYCGDGLLDPSSWDVWIELHVEQGMYLKNTEKTIGIIEDIAGIAQCKTLINGMADHAGATPMYDRQDALVAAAEFILDNERIAQDMVNTDSPTAVSTVGAIDVSPNATNVVPGNVKLESDIRDIKRASIESIIDQCRKSTARIKRNRSVEVSFESTILAPPTQMNKRCVETVSNAARRMEIPNTKMYSSALHDTSNLARETDVGMIFAPSEGGYSHSPQEWTKWEDCAAATNVLATTMANLATE